MYSVPSNVILLSSHVQLKMMSRCKKQNKTTKPFKYIWLHSILTFCQPVCAYSPLIGTNPESP